LSADCFPNNCFAEKYEQYRPLLSHPCRHSSTPTGDTNGNRPYSRTLGCPRGKFDDSSVHRDLFAYVDEPIANPHNLSRKDCQRGNDDMEGIQKMNAAYPPALFHFTCYSTVTDLARLRGWSTSLPLQTAI